MIAWQHQHASVKAGMGGDGVEHLGPFGGNTRVGHVAGNEDRIEFVLGVDRLELLQQALQAFVA